MKQYLHQIVENALDFLEKSIAEFESAPKYALLHFYTALELILKARLFADHWTLIVDSADKASIQKLEKGEFQSVTLGKALTRLDLICNSRVPLDSQRCFEQLRQHRNKVAHFYDIDAQHDDDLRRLKSHVAALVCKGWYFLHRLIDEQWSDEFNPWEAKIQTIEAQMRDQSLYLDAKWQEIRSDVEGYTAQGYIFTSCPSCGFDSMPADDFPDEGTCHVCTLLALAVPTDCPTCNSRNYLFSEGVGQCRECGNTLLPEHVWTTVSESDFYVEAEEWDDTSDRGSCGDCGNDESLIHITTGWLCTQCFAVWNEQDVSQCEWCLGYGSRIPEDSMLTGCTACDGHLGHMMGKND